MPPDISECELTSFCLTSLKSIRLHWLLDTVKTIKKSNQGLRTKLQLSLNSGNGIASALNMMVMQQQFGFLELKSVISFAAEVMVT
jgi:hypothetical protein